MKRTPATTIIFAVLAAVAIGVFFLTARDLTAGVHGRTMAILQADVAELRHLAKEQGDALQAIALEVDQLRGELARAREAMEKAGKGP